MVLFHVFLSGFWCCCWFHWFMPSTSAARAHHKAVIRRTPSSSHHVNLRSCLVFLAPIALQTKLWSNVEKADRASKTKQHTNHHIQLSLNKHTGSSSTGPNTLHTNCNAIHQYFFPY
uniref:Secreted protein n=1 Tax=Oryza glaberrima TaxID=4538 RepID=I1R549_ORYGL